MQIVFQTKKGFELTDTIKSWSEKRVNKLEKLFKDDASTRITFIQEKSGKSRVEGTISSSGLLYRAESVHEDPCVAIDNWQKAITRQLAKHKTRLSKSLRDSTLIIEHVNELAEDINEENEFKIVKNKQFELKPMSADEAILQMNLLGHDFFLFKEAKSMRTNLVYKRKSGDYGLIEI